MEQINALGRRKTSVARIYLRDGKGDIKVNGVEFGDFFGKRFHYRETATAPMRETNTMGKYDVVINVKGGGVTGQIEAIRHGIARALEKVNPAHRAVLKSMGYLTRDPREKERRKYGLAKARKAYQYSKR